MDFIDSKLLDLKVDFPCGGCDGTFDGRIRDLLPGTTLSCPSCGWEVPVTDNFLQNTLRWVADTTDRHRDIIDKL